MDTNTHHRIFVPAILFDSFGAGLSVEALQSLWVVAIIGLVTVPISAIISYPMMVISRPPDWFRDWFLFGATFQNTVALPLVLIQTICSQITVPKRDSSGAILKGSNDTTLVMTQQECTTRGELYIFMYIFLHSLLFWVVAYDLMPSTNKPKAKPSEITMSEPDVAPESQIPDVNNLPSDIEERDDLLLQDGDQEAAEQVKPVPLNLSSASTDISARSAVNNSPSTPEVAPKSESGDPMSVYMSGSIAATLKPAAMGPRKARSNGNSESYAAGSFYGGTALMERKRAPVGAAEAPTNNSCARTTWKKFKWLVLHILGLCARPPIIAQLLGMFVGLIEPLQEALFSPTSVLRPVTLSIKIFAIASTAVTNLSMSGGLGLKMKESKLKHLFGGDEGGLSRRSNLGFVVNRMLVLPAVLFGLTYLLQITKLVPQDRLLMLVLYMQTLTPSANMCVVVPQILGNHQASGALSLLVLSQYIVALPTMLLFLSLAFYVTSDLP